ncbi:hypothetical protein K2X33_11680, partial [bacterium]|nr:hypothetical protein [bacterium]
GNQRLTFSLGGKVLGSARTDWTEGTAFFSIPAPEVGMHLVSVTLDADSRYTAPVAELVLVVCERDQPLLITDVDHTLADASGTDVLFKKPQDIPVVAGAPDVLARLSQRYQVVYLTARDDSMMNRTKEWLAVARLPKAPALFWDITLSGQPPLSHTKYKTQAVGRLAKEFSNLALGVGDLVGDAEAYLANGIPAYIVLDRQDPASYPTGTHFIRDWWDLD